MAGRVERGERVLKKAAYLVGAGQAVVRDPLEGFLRVTDVLADRSERRARPFHYDADADWHRSLHSHLDVPWPCSVEGEFRRGWRTLVDEMTAHGISLGRASFGGWDDGNPALALAAYCLARQLRPSKVVETGVARGVTTRLLLEALDRNGTGALWSIDLPPLLECELEEDVGVAVPGRRHARWTLCVGSSRRRLPGVLDRLGTIDLFVHDSLHTERNLRFELDRAWRTLAPGGVLLADDVDYNAGFRTFTKEVRGGRSIIASHNDSQGLFGLILKDAATAAKLPRERGRRAAQAQS